MSIRLAVVLASALASVGCHRGRADALAAWHVRASSPTRIAPATEAERAALSQLDALGPGVAVLSLSDATITIEPIYASAIGLRCRAVVVQYEPAQGVPLRRVACRDGGAWFLIPDLLETGSSDGPEDEL